ncbi:MAG: glycosyltransferase [Candidatus Dormibacteraeota bacterium]|nr:glycosyltransferase [Candidatus Dormibacteraeota bacterium]
MDPSIAILSFICDPATEHPLRPLHRRIPPPTRRNRSRALKVLHLVAPASFGGLERVVHALAVGQKKRGYDVEVIALLETGAAKPSLIAELHGASIKAIPVTKSARAFRAQRRLVRDICRQLAPDVLHSHGYLPDVLSASLGRSLRAARVSTVHGFTGGRWKNRFYEWMQRRSYSRFNAVVAVSRPLAVRLGASRASRRRVHALPNAWMQTGDLMSPESARAALGLTRDTFNIGWVGRISREKGPDILLEALPLLKDLPVHVTMIGEGAERDRFERRAKELHVEQRVSWRGEVAAASRLMAAFDLFVNSSRTEGTPITLFEAMHAGVPIVATSVGGVPDVVSGNEAILIQPEDRAALASAIREVYQSRAEAGTRSAAARKRLAEKFAAGPWIDSYEHIYRQAITARSHA